MVLRTNKVKFFSFFTAGFYGPMVLFLRCTLVLRLLGETYCLSPCRWRQDFPPKHRNILSCTDQSLNEGRHIGGV
jgi:hypothetical protein